MWTSLADAFNFLSKLTIRRLANAVKVLLSFYLSRVTNQPKHWGMPISISIEPTTSCNLRCPECPSGKRDFTRPIGMLSSSLFEKIVDDLYRDVSYLTFYFQGEPFLNPYFLDMVSYAHAKNIYTATSTNAHFISDEVAKKTVESGLDRLIISVDGTTQEVYEQYRVGGKLEKVIEATRLIIQWKKKLKSRTPYVVFQFLVVKPNEHQLKDVKQLVKELQVDKVLLKTAQIYDFKNGSALLPSTDKYSRYRQLNDGSYALKNELTNSCWKLWHSAVITWDGMVVPCCFDKDAKHVMGDLKQSDFKQVWNGLAYQDYRSALIKARSQIDICNNCTEGTKVWA